MSVTGAGGGSGMSRVERIEVEPPPGADGAVATGTGARAAPASGRGAVPGGRHAVAASIGAGARAATVPAGATELAGFNAAVAPDGTIVPRTGGAASGPLAVLNELALRPADGPGPFDGISDAKLLLKIADRLAETHAGLAGNAPDDATALAWRQSRAACLHLMEQAAMRAFAAGDRRAAQQISARLVDAIKAEPWRQTRDFAYESLVSRAETKALPEVAAAREAIYPSKPPYEKWTADGKIDMLIYVDDNGSKISDQVDYFKWLGFKHTQNDDGSHTLTMAKRGTQPAIEITIPKKEGEPALFEKMADPKVDVIGYMGHAGYGHRVEHALAKGVGGTGEDKLVFLLQCWGEQNVESLERAYPDAQVLSTTAPTTDNYDWVLLEHMIEGFRGGKGWDHISKGAIAALKKEFKDDGEHTAEHWDGHYFFPTTRSTLVKRYDRDGDGVNDEKDHIFNVVYPKRVDAAGGYDPVVQAIPTYALDGTALNKAVADLSLSIRYNHLLPPEQERKLPWDPTKWQSGGFFEPAPGDLRAFEFTRGAGGTVSVALSTRFAHTTQEDLSRMLAYEAGLWLGKEAGLDATTRAAMGVALLERVVHQQGAWYSQEGGMLDEAWAEEALLQQRYGLEGFTFGELERLVGDPDDYKPEHFKKVLDKVKTLPGAAGLAERAPTRVGTELVPRAEIKLEGYLDEDKLDAALRSLGVEGEIKAYAPSWLAQNQPTNVVALVAKDGKTFQVSLGVDSEGVVRAAAKLELDMTRKLDQALERAVAALVPEGGGTGAITAADARAAYERQRAAGKGATDAFVAALGELRRKAPPGTSAPGLREVRKLLDMGLISPEEVAKLEAAVDRFFPDHGAALAERTFFAWVGDVAKRHRLDLAALEAKYAREAASGEGGPAARARGLLAVLDALPRDAGKPESTTVCVLLANVSGPTLFPAGVREATLAKVQDKLGLTRADLAAEAFMDAIPLDRAKTAPVAEKLKTAIAGGKPLGDAVEEALVAVSRLSAEWLSVDAEPFTALGLVLAGSAEKEALDARLCALENRFGAEATFFAWAAQVDGRRTPEQIRAAYHDKLTANPSGGPAAACRAVLETLPARAKPKLDILPTVVRIVRPADQPALVRATIERFGLAPEKALRTILDAENIDPATKRAALEAFDAKLRGGGTAADALVAFAERAGSDYGVRSVIDTALRSHLFPREDLIALRGRLRRAEERAICDARLPELASELAGGPAEGERLVRELRERVARGGGLEDELIRLARSLPRRPDETGAPAWALVPLLRTLPAERKGELLEAFLASQGLTRADFVFRQVQAHVQLAADSPELAEARRRFDAALAAGPGDLLAAAQAAMERAEPYQRQAARAALVELGLADAAAVRRLDAREMMAARWVSEQVAAVVSRLGGAGDDGSLLRRLQEREARPGATPADVVEEALAAVGPRRPGPPQPGAPFVGVAGALVFVDPAVRPELARRLYERAGWSVPDVLRALLESACDDVAPAADRAAVRAAFDGAARRGNAEAVIAAIRAGALEPAIVDHLEANGLLAAGEVAKVRAAFPY